MEPRFPFTRKQLDCLDVLTKHYPRGISTTEPEHREVFNSLLERDPPMVAKVPMADVPSGDAYVLTDEAADAFRNPGEGSEMN